MSSTISALDAIIQRYSNQDKLDNLLANPPQREPSKQWDWLLNMANQKAAGQQPGYAQSKMDIGQAGAEATTTLKESSISSRNYNAEVQRVLNSKLQAYQDLNKQSAQWQDEQVKNIIDIRKNKAQEEWALFTENYMRPYETKANIYSSGMAAGQAGQYANTPSDETFAQIFNMFASQKSSG
jgi:hypothetical protein